MNRIYKVIWSKTKNCYVVASELVHGNTKATNTGMIARRAALAAVAALLLLPAGSDVFAASTGTTNTSPMGYNEITVITGDQTDANAINTVKDARISVSSGTTTVNGVQMNNGDINANDITAKDITATGDISAKDVTATGDVSAKDITASGTIHADGVMTSTGLNTQGGAISGGAISGGAITGTSLNTQGGDINGGAITGTSLNAGAGAVTAGSGSFAGNVSAGSLDVTNKINGGSLEVTGDAKIGGTLDVKEFNADKLQSKIDANNFTTIEGGSVHSKNFDAGPEQLTSESTFDKTGRTEYARDDDSIATTTTSADGVTQDIRDVGDHPQKMAYRELKQTPDGYMITDEVKDPENSSTFNQKADQIYQGVTTTDGTTAIGQSGRNITTMATDGTNTTTTTQDASNITNEAKTGTITNDAKDIANIASEDMTNTIGRNLTTTVGGEMKTTVTGDVIEDYKANLITTVGSNQTTTVTGDSSLTAENITNEAKNKITNKAIDVETDATSSIVHNVTNDAGSNTSVQLSYQTMEEMSQADGKTASYLRGAAEEKSQLIDGSKKTTIDTVAGQTNTNITDGTNISNDLQKADQIASSVTDGTNTTVVNQDAMSLASSITDGTKINNTNNTVDKSEQLIKASDTLYSATSKTATKMEDALVNGSTIIDIVKDSTTGTVISAVTDGSTLTGITQNVKDISLSATGGTIANEARNITNKAAEDMTNDIGRNLTTTVGGEMKTTVTGDVMEDYQSDLSTTVGGDMSTEVTGDQSTTVHGDQSNTVEGTLTETITGKATENYNGGLETTITGEEKHTVNGSQITNITGDQTNTIGGDMSTEVTGDQSTTVKGDQSNTVEGTLTETITGDVMEDYQSDLSTTVGGDMSTEVTGDQSIAVYGNQSNTVEGNQTTTIGGDMSTTVTGDSSLRAKSIINEADTSITDMVGTTTVTTTDGLTTLTNREGTHKTQMDFAEVGKDLSVGGNATVGGSMTASSYKVGDKTYIDSNGINANNQTITNVAPGELSATSTDAVNGAQLFDTNQKMRNFNSRLNRVGAGAAALAALHPLDFDPDSKWNFAAGYGNYRDANAAAVGLYYRPNEDTMFSVGGSFGGGENMVNAGVSLKLGRGSHVSNSRVAMAKEIRDMRKAMAEQAAEIAELKAMHHLAIDPNKSMLFPDVADNHWAYEYVTKLAGNGIIEGYPDGLFKGNQVMTRYEFAAIVYRLMEKGMGHTDPEMNRLAREFSNELSYIRIDTVHQDKDGTPTVQRVRVKK
ncbi:bacteriophage T4 gp5 trimerisation domain-containing protein [uncultured Megasphaera sp.]|uniref:ESPR-type extended signal peptide-containing protein n=1 Tax=uncultured Megasphaera sp. TaxID=165188 RepID=UPI0025DB906D|nr:ESPR-type extended signal peptide-containing protein [uncultured Megasphaera sp.]